MPSPRFLWNARNTFLLFLVLFRAHLDVLLRESISTLGQTDAEFSSLLSTKQTAPVRHCVNEHVFNILRLLPTIDSPTVNPIFWKPLLTQLKPRSCECDTISGSKGEHVIQPWPLRAFHPSGHNDWFKDGQMVPVHTIRISPGSF